VRLAELPTAAGSGISHNGYTAGRAHVSCGHRRVPIASRLLEVRHESRRHRRCGCCRTRGSASGYAGKFGLNDGAGRRNVRRRMRASGVGPDARDAETGSSLARTGGGARRSQAVYRVRGERDSARREFPAVSLTRCCRVRNLRRV
jgi:hypothetical protein